MAHLAAEPKYTKDKFNSELDKLVTYFKPKLNRDIVTAYYERVSIYPFEALKWAVDNHISENKPTAGNFPTPAELSNRCAIWLDERPGLKHNLTIYDVDNDPEYPIGKLFDASWVLEHQGEIKFREFVLTNRMPKQDIERVLYKNKISAEKLREATENIGK